MSGFALQGEAMQADKENLMSYSSAISTNLMSYSSAIPTNVIRRSMDSEAFEGSSRNRSLDFEELREEHSELVSTFRMIENMQRVPKKVKKAIEKLVERGIV